LHHDNAVSYTPISVKRCLANLAQCNVFKFPKLKIPLKSPYFESHDNIQGNVITTMNGFSENDFQQRFHAWKINWNACTKTEGKYSEGHPTQ
jgi:hypothetical protein